MQTNKTIKEKNAQQYIKQRLYKRLYKTFYQKFYNHPIMIAFIMAFMFGVIPSFFSCSQHLPIQNQHLKKSHVLKLTYQDFGPQALAHKLLGMQWWSWENHGDSTPKNYSIQVIVYKDIELHQVKKHFPISPNKKQDYRYIKAERALFFLEKSIQELQEDTKKPISLIQLEKRLQNTKEIIKTKFY